MSNLENYGRNVYSTSTLTNGMFLGLSNNLRQAVLSIPKKKGFQIYDNPADLEQYLTGCDVPELERYRFLLLVSVPGFFKMLDNKSLTNLEISTFIMEAYAKTGLFKHLIIMMLGLILESGGVVNNLPETERKLIVEENFSFIIPYSYYEEDLKTILRGKKDEKYYAILDELVALGVPKAKYIKGKDKITDNKDYFKGYKLIKEAAEAGDEEAERYLARKCFCWGVSDWNEAYNHYTGVSTALLHIEDRENLVKLFNHRIFNKRLLFADLALIFLSLLILIFMPNLNLFVGKKVVTWISFATQIVLWLIGINQFKKKPYSSLYEVTGGIVLVFLFVVLFQLYF